MGNVVLAVAAAVDSLCTHFQADSARPLTGMNLAGGAGLGLGTGEVRILIRPRPPLHQHESIKETRSRICFGTMFKKERKEEQRISGLRISRLPRKTVPWKNDLKPFPQKQIIGDGRRSNKRLETPPALKQKPNKYEGSYCVWIM